ncbi:MAG: putative ABC transporter permease/ATP-binding protein [Bacillota bacterium]|nr:MAG: putative ABC transporter permease/ATP-binding protein [Bacillota bacterium]
MSYKEVIKNSSALRLFWSLLPKQRMLLIIILSFLATLLSLGSPFVIRFLLDSVLPSQNLNHLVVAALLLILLPLSARGVGHVIVKQRILLTAVVQSALQSKVMSSYLSGPIARILEYPIGHVNTVILSDCQILVIGIVSLIEAFAQSLVTLGVTIYFLLSTSPHLVVGVVLVSLCRFPFQRKMASLSKEGTALQQSWQSELSTNTTDSFNGIQTVKLYVLEDKQSQALQARVLKKYREMGVIERRLQAVISMETLLNACIPALVYGYGGYLALMGKASLGVLVAALQFVSRGTESLNALVGLYARAKPLTVHSHRINEFLEFPNEFSSSPPQIKGVPSKVQELVVRDVFFRYKEEDSFLLQGVSFSVTRGVLTALAGASGSGKTTLCSILCRLGRPRSGSILLNGIDVQELDLRAYREAVALYTDMEYYFAGSIRDNLMIAKSKASCGEIARALYISTFDEVLLTLPAGLDTIIGKAGRALSSGQKQRLSLARMVLREPQVVLLDEFTSHVDPLSEGAMRSRIEPWLRERVSLIVSHKEGTLEWADRILVLEHGKVSEKNGSYSKGGNQYALVAASSTKA